MRDRADKLKEKYKPSGFIEEKEHLLLDTLISNYGKIGTDIDKLPDLEYIELAVRFNNGKKIKSTCKLYVRLTENSKNKAEYIKYCNSIVSQLFASLSKITKSTSLKVQVT